MSTGEKLTFWQLINSKDLRCIEIPRIQRDYVQGRKTHHVEYARTKIIKEMLSAIQSNQPMDLNFVYGQENDNIFIPIDGQQRLSTLLALHIYAFSKENEQNDLKILKEKFKYSTRISTSRFLISLISNFMDFFKTSYQDVTAYIEDAAWYSPAWDNDPSVNSFKIVLNEIHAEAQHINGLSNKLKGVDCPISFMSLQISDIGLSNDLYIKMNSRGKSLTEFESFKSALFDFVDSILEDDIKRDFKQKTDNQWLNYIWDSCEDAAPSKCDSVYMQFWHQIIMNRLIPGGYADNSDEWYKLNNNTGFYNFANYKLYLKDARAIKDIYFTMDFFDFVRNKDTDLFKTIRGFMLNSNDLTHKDQVRVAAITKYAITISKKDWNIEKFKCWFRICNNLINSTQIDKLDLYSKACKSLDDINEKMVASINEYLSDTANINISFFDSKQVDEEILKCKLIKHHIGWEQSIKKAENHSYFLGEILFALRLCQANDITRINDHEKALKEFEQSWNTIECIFNENEVSKLRVDDNLFRRALLTYGDYSCWANSSYTYFFEGGKGYFNWRRMLREEKSFKVFSKLFNDLKSENITTAEDVNKFLKSKIENYQKNPPQKDFSYYVITIPEIMQYMKEKRFRTVDDYNKRYLLYSKATLSAEYAEAYSFFVFCHIQEQDKEYHFGRGQLNSDTTFAYIEKIGKQNCHIEYSENGYFCDENRNPYLSDNKEPIATVEDMLLYIDQNFK